MSEWIDFKTLRKGLSFEKILEFYGIQVKKRPGERHMGFCPLPTHQGKKRSASFSAKLNWGVWQCFGCKARGNLLDFATRMEGLDPAKPEDLRQVALKLQQHFQVPGASGRNGQPGPAPPQPQKQQPSAPRPTTPHVIINPPLDFELKDLDYEHPYLKQRGFLPETIRHFGLGYCNRGLMKGRIAIPLHDNNGRLIGYAGRLVDDAAVSPENPKYLLPGTREKAGRVTEFRKSLFLYNGHRVRQPSDDLIVVEGYPSCWWLTQWGYNNVVALMGSDCSEEQSRLIVSKVKRHGRVSVLPDAGGAGERCAVSVLSWVSQHRLCRWVKLSGGQPTDHTPGDLAIVL